MPDGLCLGDASDFGIWKAEVGLIVVINVVSVLL